MFEVGSKRIATLVGKILSQREAHRAPGYPFTFRIQPGIPGARFGHSPLGMLTNWLGSGSNVVNLCSALANSLVSSARLYGPQVDRHVLSDERSQPVQQYS